MELFVRESGSPGAPVIVFLHGAERSGESWRPVVDRMQHYRCLVPDLPHHGESVQVEPFDMAQAASAVAKLIRSRAGTSRVHLVGHSLGAQVGVQLLATEPELVDRAVLCGAVINTMPGVRPIRLLAGAIAGVIRSIRISLSAQQNAQLAEVSPARANHFKPKVLLLSGTQIAQIVTASVGFTPPEGLGSSQSPTLFLAGAREWPVVRQSGAVLGQRMPNGFDGVVRGMNHDWPLEHPGLFVRTVDRWISGAPLPPQVSLSKNDPR
jgi:pimeloyl-ACP methyl ester carboxylesterase